MGKAAAAAGAVANYSAPAAEAAMGESVYFGLLQLHGALAAASADEKRPMKAGAGEGAYTSTGPHPFLSNSQLESRRFPSVNTTTHVISLQGAQAKQQSAEK